jgi:hypothetical protein
MSRICTLGAFVLLTAIFALPQTVVVQRSVNLRSDPSVVHAPVGKLKPKAKLKLVSPDETNGFLHVRTNTGLDGWVWSKNVAVKEGALSTATSNNGGCSTVRDLASCPDSGCTKDKKTGRLKAPSIGIQTASHLKKLISLATVPKILTLDDFATLQSIAKQRVGEHRELDETKRVPLSQGIDVSSGSVVEGDLVQVVGYVSELRVNTGEAVSCYLSEEASNDYHINITRVSGQTEFQGIVVEMIPQHRLPSWKSSDIESKLKGKNKMVRVTGQLFYDSGHSVNKDPKHPIKSGQPRRFSLWEVHPVRNFEVCKHSGDCDVGSVAEWEPF